MNSSSARSITECVPHVHVLKSAQNSNDPRVWGLPNYPIHSYPQFQWCVWATGHPPGDANPRDTNSSQSENDSFSCLGADSSRSGSHRVLSALFLMWSLLSQEMTFLSQSKLNRTLKTVFLLSPPMLVLCSPFKEQLLWLSPSLPGFGSTKACAYQARHNPRPGHLPTFRCVPPSLK